MTYKYPTRRSVEATRYAPAKKIKRVRLDDPVALVDGEKLEGMIFLLDDPAVVGFLGGG